MILTGLRTEVEDGRAVLRSRFEFADDERESFEHWIAVPAEYADHLDESATPFVPLAALVAARLGERLRVDGPVSERIVTGAERATALFADWWGYRPLRIKAPRKHVEGASSERTGVLYSRGVDTSAVVVRSRTGRIPERVTHLLTGYDIEWVFTSEVQREVWAGHERAAAAWGLPLVRMESNARDLLHGLIGWPRCFGVAYIGPALALGPMFGSIVTGATQPVAGAIPRGSRYDLDILWSTETTAVRQDAFELTRAQRIDVVALDPVALESLKVCWAGRGARNCGQCCKCLRTMTALWKIGVLDGTSFDGELTPEAVRAAPVERAVSPLWAAAESVASELPELAAAWREKATEAEAVEKVENRRRARTRRRQRVRRARRRIRRRARRVLKRR